ncbi:MAG: DUF167 domain-containing protein [Nanoarchaeota archaeon]
MIIFVKVKPNSKENKLVKKGEEYTAYISEPADKGKANNALIRLLAKEFGVGKSDIKIKTPISRRKIVEIKKD